MTHIPYLMPLALLAYAGYRYWAQRSAEIDSATSAWALRLGRVPGTTPAAGSTPTLSQYPCTTDVELDALAEQARYLAGRVLAEGLLHRPGASSLA